MLNVEIKEAKDVVLLFSKIDNTQDGEVEKTVTLGHENLNIACYQPKIDRSHSYRLSLALISAFIQTYYYDLDILWQLLFDSVQIYADRILFTTDHISSYPTQKDNTGRTAYKIYETIKKITKQQVESQLVDEDKSQIEDWKIEFYTNIEAPFDVEIQVQLQPTSWNRRHYYRVEASYLRSYFDAHCLATYLHSKREKAALDMSTNGSSSPRHHPHPLQLRSPDAAMLSSSIEAATASISASPYLPLASTPIAVKQEQQIPSSPRSATSTTSATANADDITDDPSSSAALAIFERGKIANLMLDALVEELLYDPIADELLIKSIDQLKLKDYSEEMERKQEKALQLQFTREIQMAAVSSPRNKTDLPASHSLLDSTTEHISGSATTPRSPRIMNQVNRQTTLLVESIMNTPRRLEVLPAATMPVAATAQSTPFPIQEESRDGVLSNGPTLVTAQQVMERAGDGKDNKLSNLLPQLQIVIPSINAVPSSVVATPTTGKAPITATITAADSKGLLTPTLVQARAPSSPRLATKEDKIHQSVKEENEQDEDDLLAQLTQEAISPKVLKPPPSKDPHRSYKHETTITAVEESSAASVAMPSAAINVTVKTVYNDDEDDVDDGIQGENEEETLLLRLDQQAALEIQAANMHPGKFSPHHLHHHQHHLHQADYQAQHQHAQQIQQFHHILKDDDSLDEDSVDDDSLSSQEDSQQQKDKDSDKFNQQLLLSVQDSDSKKSPKNNKSKKMNAKEAAINVVNDDDHVLVVLAEQDLQTVGRLKSTRSSFIRKSIADMTDIIIIQGGKGGSMMTTDENNSSSVIIDDDSPQARLMKLDGVVAAASGNSSSGFTPVTPSNNKANKAAADDTSSSTVSIVTLPTSPKKASIIKSALKKPSNDSQASQRPSSGGSGASARFKSPASGGVSFVGASLIPHFTEDHLHDEVSHHYLPAASSGTVTTAVALSKDQLPHEEDAVLQLGGIVKTPALKALDPSSKQPQEKRRSTRKSNGNDKSQSSTRKRRNVVKLSSRTIRPIQDQAAAAALLAKRGKEGDDQQDDDNDDDEDDSEEEEDECNGEDEAGQVVIHDHDHHHTIAAPRRMTVTESLQLNQQHHLQELQHQLHHHHHHSFHHQHLVADQGQQQKDQEQDPDHYQMQRSVITYNYAEDVAKKLDVMIKENQQVIDQTRHEATMMLTNKTNKQANILNENPLNLALQKQAAINSSIRKSMLGSISAAAAAAAAAEAVAAASNTFSNMTGSHSELMKAFQSEEAKHFMVKEALSLRSELRSAMSSKLIIEFLQTGSGLGQYISLCSAEDLQSIADECSLAEVKPEQQAQDAAAGEGGSNAATGGSSLLMYGVSSMINANKTYAHLGIKLGQPITNLYIIVSGNVLIEREENRLQSIVTIQDLQNRPIDQDDDDDADELDRKGKGSTVGKGRGGGISELDKSNSSKRTSNSSSSSNSNSTKKKQSSIIPSSSRTMRRMMILSSGDMIGGNLLSGEYLYDSEILLPTSLAARKYQERSGITITGYTTLCKIPISTLERYVGRHGEDIAEYMIYFWKRMRLWLDIQEYNKSFIQSSIYQARYQLVGSIDFSSPSSSSPTQSQAAAMAAAAAMGGGSSSIGRTNKKVSKYRRKQDMKSYELQTMNVIDTVRLRTYHAGDEIFTQGVPRNYLYILKQGQATYYRCFPKEQFADIIPEKVETTIYFDKEHSDNQNLEEQRAAGIGGGTLLSHDYSFMDSEDLFFLHHMEELDAHFLQISQQGESIQATEYRRKKYHRFERHKNTLIAVTRCEVLVVHLTEIAKCMSIFSKLLLKSIQSYPSLLVSNEDVIHRYHEKQAWLRQKMIVFQEIEQDLIERTLQENYAHTSGQTAIGYESDRRYSSRTIGSSSMKKRIVNKVRTRKEEEKNGNVFTGGVDTSSDEEGEDNEAGHEEEEVMDIHLGKKQRNYHLSAVKSPELAKELEKITRLSYSGQLEQMIITFTATNRSGSSMIQMIHPTASEDGAAAGGSGGGPGGGLSTRRSLANSTPSQRMSATSAGCGGGTGSRPSTAGATIMVNQHRTNRLSATTATVSCSSHHPVAAGNGESATGAASTNHKPFMSHHQQQHQQQIFHPSSPEAMSTAQKIITESRIRRNAMSFQMSDVHDLIHHSNQVKYGSAYGIKMVKSKPSTSTSGAAKGQGAAENQLQPHRPDSLRPSTAVAAAVASAPSTPNYNASDMLSPNHGGRGHHRTLKEQQGNSSPTDSDAAASPSSRRRPGSAASSSLKPTYTQKKKKPILTPEEYVNLYRERITASPKQRFIEEFILKVHL